MTEIFFSGVLAAFVIFVMLAAYLLGYNNGWYAGWEDKTKQSDNEVRAPQATGMGRDQAVKIAPNRTHEHDTHIRPSD
jgi:hypothetical protein